MAKIRTFARNAALQSREVFPLEAIDSPVGWPTGESFKVDPGPDGVRLGNK
jgi:hypothetical protein